MFGRLQSWKQHSLTLTLTFCAVFCTLCSLCKDAALAQEPAETKQQESLVVDRFLSILENNPQRGTAFDQVFDYHVQGGTLDTFVAYLTDKIKKNEDDGSAWMIMGLIESQRRNDMLAATAFANAEKLRPKDAFAPYYRGQLLFRSGEHKEAIDALESAVDRKPNRALLVEIIELLGRCHERLEQSELAEQTWKRLEDLFPNDLRILERIASVQNQEGMFKEALKRYEQLGQKATDAYQRTQYRMEAAQLRIKLGNTEQGLTELGTILAELNPESWLFKDCQSKLEDNFLKVKDLGNLIAFYERRIDSNPNDLESIMRLSKHLYSTAKIQDAIDWSSKAVALAPSRADLRIALIAQLVNGQQWSRADENYRALSALDPSNIDVAKAWGAFTLSDPSRGADETKKAAGQIWHDLLIHRPTDARAHVQVAELFVSSQQFDEAQKLFERAVELRPDDPQYLENLGDFHFSQKRRDKAIEIWESTAAGPLRSAESLFQLAEIYHRVRLTDLAADRAEEACKLAPRNTVYRLRTAEFQKLCNRIDAALETLAAADLLADDDAQHERILSERLDILENSRRLKGAADALSLELNSKPDAAHAQWQLLVRYLVRMRRWIEADAAVDRAQQLDENSVASLKSAADIAEALGNSQRAISSLKKLCDLDRRKRTEYFERIATQQMLLGEKSAAIETAQQMIDANPSRIEGYQFYAELCFRSMKFEPGIDALRKALRMDPKSNAIIDSLGNAFSKNKKHAEAIELYKQRFYRAESCDERLELISKLIAHHTSQGSTSTLIDLLERDRKQVDLQHDLTLCLAQVYVSTSEYAKAKSLLDDLLTTQPRDRMILERLVSVCSAMKDPVGAIDYQRKLVAVDPKPEHESYLATLLRQHGKLEESEAITLRILKNEPDSVALIRTLDELLIRGESELVRQTVEPILGKEPGNWPLLYRLGIAYIDLDRLQEAKDIWETAFELNVNHSATSYQGQSPSNQPNFKLAPIATTIETLCEPTMTTIAGGDFKLGSGKFWAPQNFGELRMASLAWLVYCKEMGVSSRIIGDDESDSSLSDLPVSSLLNLLALSRFKQDAAMTLRVMEAFVTAGHKEVLPYFLQVVKQRNIVRQLHRERDVPHLSDSQINAMLEAFDFVQNPMTTHWVSAPPGNPTAAPISFGKLIANRANRFLSYPARPESFIETVVNELDYADKLPVAEEFIAKLCNSATSPYQLETLCEYLLEENRLDQIEKPLLRWLDASRTTYDQNADAALFIPTSTPNAIEFAVRYVHASSNSISWQIISKILNAILDLENSRLLAKSFTPTELSQIVWQFASKDERPSQLQVSSNSAWPNNFVSPLIRNLMQEPVAKQHVAECESLLDARVKDARETVSQFERLRQAVLQDSESSADRGLLASKILLELCDQPGFALQVAIGLIHLGQLDLAEEAALNASTQNKEESQLRDLILILATKRHDDSVKLNELLSKFDFKSLDSESIQLLRSSLREIEKFSPTPMRPSATTVNQLTQQAPANFPKAMSQALRATANPQQPTATPIPSGSELERLERTDVEAAVKMARSTVRKPVHLIVPIRTFRLQYLTPAKQTSSMSMYPGGLINRGSKEKEVRDSAFAILKKHNELQTLIDEARKGIEESPDSFLLHQLLAEYFESLGDIDAADIALGQAIRIRPTATKTRHYHVDLLYRNGKYAEAIVEFLELLQRDPDCALSNMSHYKDMFNSPETNAKILESIKQLPSSVLVDQNSIQWSAVTMAKTALCFEIGATILEKLHESQSADKVTTLEYMYKTIGTNFPRMLNFTAQAFIPNEKQVAHSPWFGFRDNYGATVSNSETELLDAIFQVHSPESILVELERPIREAVNRLPNWLGGKLLLVTILAKRNAGKERDELLDSLASIKDLQTSCPRNAFLRLGIELAKVTKYQLLAIRILSTKSSQVFMSAEQRSAKLAVARIWVLRGNPEKAVDVLTTDARFGSSGIGSARTGLNLRSSPSFSQGNISVLAHDYLIIGMPIESYICFSSPYLPRDESNPDAKEVGIKATVQFLENMPVDLALAELLFDRTRLNLSNTVLELMIDQPTFSQAVIQPMESVVYRELRRHAQSGKSSEISKALDALAIKHPDDLSVALLRTRWILEANEGDITAAFDELNQLLSFTKPDNTTQAAALWFVARACYQSKKYPEIADRFAEEAYGALLRTDKQQFSMQTRDRGVTYDKLKNESTDALLWEWGTSLINSGKIEQGKVKLAELVMRRPESAKVVATYLGALKR